MAPGAKDHHLTDRFLSELAETLDIRGTIKKLDISEDDARAMLRALVKKRPAHRDLFDSDHKPHTRHRGVWTINVDGASRGNPGEAGAGAVIKDPEGQTVKKLKKYLGRATNNVAEYNAILIALESARDLGLNNIRILADSELMVKQLNGVYRVKSADLKPLYDRAVELLSSFKDCKVVHVYREDNSAADSLANEAIDTRKK